MQQVSLPTFVFVGFVAAASPGPDVMPTRADGARCGLKGATPGVMGTVASHATAIHAISLGMDVLLATSNVDLAAIR